MNLNEYQQRAMQTRIYRESGALVYPALKLADRQARGKLGGDGDGR